MYKHLTYATIVSQLISVLLEALFKDTLKLTRYIHTEDSTNTHDFSCVMEEHVCVFLPNIDN